ncbi:MAG: MmgE/PrpD family protein [Chloroflexota bacterium]|nr:MmgE/PrpD family protein [Chloroflexota bacterium]
MSTMALAKYVSGLKFEDLPAPVVEQAKNVVQDCIGLCAFVGRNTPSGRVISEFAIDQGGGQAEATVIGYPKKTVATRAALANGTTAYAYEYNDIYVPAPCHIYPIIVPAALAVAELLGSSGRDLLTAIVAGVEVHGKVGRASGKSRGRGTLGRGLVSSRVYGVFGAAAAASKLLGLDAEWTARAMGMSADYAGGCFQGMAEGAWTRNWHGGLGAEAGVISALLAKRGFVGPLRALEGEQNIYRTLALDFDPPKLTEGLGKGFEISNIWFKRYPVNGAWQGGVEAVLDLIKENHIDHKQVAQVRGHIFELTRLHEKKEAPNIVVAQFSLSYCLAVALVKGKVTVDEFTDEALKDPTTLAFSQDKVEAVFDEDLQAIGMEQETMPTRVVIKMKDGREYSKEVLFPRGHRRNPMSPEELKAKFDGLATRALPADKVSQLYQALRGLDKAKSVSHLNKLMTP